MLSRIKDILLTGISISLLFGSIQALAFDPNAALRQQESERQAQKVSDEQSLYEGYRNSEEIEINEDGTVTIGNLQWMRCSLGQRWSGTSCTGEASRHRWREALVLPDLMNDQGGFAGYSDWRLPNISELASLRVCSSGRASTLVDLPDGVATFEKCSGDFSIPTLDTNLFPNSPSARFWSSSPFAGRPSNAWGVFFDRGYVGDNVSIGSSIILVRDAK